MMKWRVEWSGEGEYRYKETKFETERGEYGKEKDCAISKYGKLFDIPEIFS